VEGAACAQTDPELFFPEKGQPAASAKLVCRRCPAAAACLDFALNSPIRVEGIWGGTTYKERQELRRQNGVKTDNYYDRCGTSAVRGATTGATKRCAPIAAAPKC
jgi:WhiB family redox-sensing transcriptional regulator